MFRVLITISVFLIGITAGLMLSSDKFESLSAQEMQQRIVDERDFAIQKAVEDGDYHCCIEPPCTMCFMEANEWNNYTVGTCACDDLIAQGKEACPQCQRGLGLNGEGATCDSNL